MADNILETLQKLIQDVIAPGVRELQVKSVAAERQRETEYKALQDQLSSMTKQNEAQYKAIMSAIGEANAKSELESMRLVSTLSERVAVLEAARH